VRQRSDHNGACGAPGAGKLARRVRECGPGKRTGRKTGTAPRADFHHAVTAFRALGSPDRSRFGVTALDDPNSQYIWLDDPNGTHSFPLPTVG
jgi:hypothetical protein